MPFEMKWVIGRSNKAETTQKLRKNYAKTEGVKMRQKRGKNAVQMRCKFKMMKGIEKELKEVKV